MSGNIQVVSGVIESIGAGVAQVGMLYGYIRIRDVSGQVQVIENVIVHSNVDSCLAPGVTGQFYFTRYRGTPLLFGSVIGRDINDDAEKVAEHGSLTSLAFPGLVIAALAVPVFGGLQALGGTAVLGLVAAMVYPRFKAYKNLPTAKRMRRTLQAAAGHAAQAA